MTPFQSDLLDLMKRDLDKVIENVKAIPEEQLWETPEGVTNSCGVLARHLAGNLNHYIGYGLGATGYIRDRDLEFTSTGVTGEDLVSQLEKLKKTMETVFQALDSEKLDEEYPLDIPYDASVQKFLIHLYGHLNYHLGQMNYLRRILSQS